MKISYYTDSKGQKWRVYSNVFGSMVRQEPVIEETVVPVEPVIEKVKRTKKVK